MPRTIPAKNTRVRHASTILLRAGLAELAALAELAELALVAELGMTLPRRRPGEAPANMSGSTHAKQPQILRLAALAQRL